MIALVFKLGAAPFHSWAPDLYSRLSFSYTSFFTLLPKLTVLGFLILQSFDHSMFALVALLSLIVGAIGISGQWLIGRFVAYSSMVHLGYFFLAISSFTSFLFYAFVYGITLLAFFIGISKFTNKPDAGIEVWLNF